MKKYFEDLHADMARHALEEAPMQMCGVIVETALGMKYFRAKNTADDRYHSSKIDPSVLERAREHGSVVAYVQSHVDYAHASFGEMERQASLGLAFGIVFVKHGRVRDVCFFGDELPIQDYVGRPFWRPLKTSTDSRRRR
jgi:proteasome lid subunit RPN8/RPN11